MVEGGRKLLGGFFGEGRGCPIKLYAHLNGIDGVKETLCVATLYEVFIQTEYRGRGVGCRN